jgi:hypothetical protein
MTLDTAANRITKNTSSERTGMASPRKTVTISAAMAIRAPKAML